MQVCDDTFNNAAATVVCRQVGAQSIMACIGMFTALVSHKCCSVALPQLGIGTTGIAMPGGHFGHGGNEQERWLSKVNCRGDEARLEECVHAGWSISDW